MRLSIIVAMATNRVIGRDGRLPWHLSADLRRFKRLTMGHHLLMGRRTFESIGRVLPGRIMVVVSRRRPRLPPEVRLAPSLAAAVEIAREAGDDEAFVAGGGEIYRLALPLAHRIYLTEVAAEVAGDTLFPVLEEGAWRELSRRAVAADDRHPHPFSFVVLERRGDGPAAGDGERAMLRTREEPTDR